MQGVQVDKYFEDVEDAVYNEDFEAYTFPCNANPPTLGFLIGDTYWAKIPGNSLILGRISGNSTEIFSLLPIFDNNILASGNLTTVANVPIDTTCVVAINRSQSTPLKSS